MKPIKVALIVKNSRVNVNGDKRNMGWWSYSVPEFEWQVFPSGETIHLSMFRNNYDLIFVEDGGKPLDRDGYGPPIVFLAFDSTLSDRHYQDRLNRAKVADLILLDHDKPVRFKFLKKPVRQFPYCTNDKLYKPLEKKIDVAFMCSGDAKGTLPGGKERHEIRVVLGEYCEKAGLSYRSGVAGVEEYAKIMGAAKIVVNWPRTPINRPHRVFDAMACKACLVTGRLPFIKEDLLNYGELETQWEFDQIYQLPTLIDELINKKTYDYNIIANEGYNLVMNNHTWAIRAQQLRQILREEFGL